MTTFATTPPAPSLTTHLLTSSELQSNTHLLSSCSDLINRSFRENRRERPLEWDHERARLLPGQSVVDALGPDALCAVTCLGNDHKEDINADADADGDFVPVAFAAAVPWVDTDGGNTAGTDDLEIKLVCLDPDPTYARRGIAAHTWNAVVNAVVALRQTRNASHPTTTLKLWLLSAEALTGEYWTKQGWTLSRTRTVPSGTWGSRKDFDMLTFYREIEL